MLFQSVLFLSLPLDQISTHQLRRYIFDEGRRLFVGDSGNLHGRRRFTMLESFSGPWTHIALALAFNSVVVFGCFSIRRGKVAFGVMAVSLFTVSGVSWIPGTSQTTVLMLEIIGTVAGMVFWVQYFKAKVQSKKPE